VVGATGIEPVTSSVSGKQSQPGFGYEHSLTSQDPTATRVWVARNRGVKICYQEDITPGSVILEVEERGWGTPSGAFKRWRHASQLSGGCRTDQPAG